MEFFYNQTSTSEPVETTLSDGSVSVPFEIKETEDGYTYHVVIYTKQEWASFQESEVEDISSQISDIQLALCDIYEQLLGGVDN